MTIQLNVFGQRYDDAEPCFLTIQGDLVYNRVTRKWQNFAALDARRIELGHDWQSRELGLPSIPWQQANPVGPGQWWAPGLDDTAGTASEAVTNGEVWTGATGSTPPTSWADATGNLDFTLAAGVLTATNPETDAGSLAQTLTTVADETYVLEIKFGAGTTAGINIKLDDQKLAHSGGPGVVAAGWFANDTEVVLAIDVAGGGTLVVDYVRFYLASELTGGAAVSGVTGFPSEPSEPSEPPSSVVGPYMSDDVKYWVDQVTCKVGFNLDDDLEPDLWMTSGEVCDAGISDEAKMGISLQLQMCRCPKLPCVLSSSQAMTASYLKAYNKDENP